MSVEQPRTPLFPGSKEGTDRVRDITLAEVANATEIIRSLAARTMTGEPRAVPYELYEAIQALTPQPVVEVVVIDGKGRYALMRRPLDDKTFGPGRLHVLGGFLKPDRKGISMVDAGRKMIEDEMGVADAEYVAGPIATRQWTRTIDHPTAWPNSQVYVLKVPGDIPDRDDVVWFDNDKLPTQDEVIICRPGQIHQDFLRVYQEWCKNPQQPCRDLNEKPLPAMEA